MLGVATLGYCGFVQLDATVYQSHERRSFELVPERAASDPVARAEQVVQPGSPLGLLDIPSIGLSAVIAEGVDASTLRRALGHVPGTALATSSGNMAIAGHRDTFFRSLKDIRTHAEITLTTAGQRHRYRVEWTKVIPPNDTQVLETSSENTLTLITCYPFHYVGPAPRRFIVRAKRISE